MQDLRNHVLSVTVEMALHSELVAGSDLAAITGSFDPEHTRCVEVLMGAAVLVPRDLFFGRSGNPYLDRHLKMDSGWYPPARWLPGPPG